MSTIRSVDHSAMREINLSVVLDTLRRHEPISRTGLARISGLNKTTVSSLIRELQDSELVYEIQPITTDAVGRPPIALMLNPDAGTIIGAEIGVDFVSAIVADFSAKVLWRKVEDTSGLSDQEAILEKALKIFQIAYSKAEKLPGRIFGLGLGVPGLVNSDTGTLLVAPNLGWKNVPLRQRLMDRFHIPVYVDNEANLAALGETYFGAATAIEQVLYVSSGVGLGGGIVLNGQILTGATGFSGEIGHMTMVVENGLPCNCGNYGCWETLASQWAVFRRIKDAVGQGRSSSLEEKTSGNLDRLTIPLVVQAADEGDQVAIAALEETGYWLGIGLANLINALNPRGVVIGGILTLAQDYLMPIIRSTAAERAWRYSYESCNIVVAEHGEHACVMGGVAVVYRQLLSEPQAWT
jgi:glucokinase-like ROK family protein